MKRLLIASVALLAMGVGAVQAADQQRDRTQIRTPDQTRTRTPDQTRQRLQLDCVPLNQSSRDRLNTQLRNPTQTKQKQQIHK